MKRKRKMVKIKQAVRTHTVLYFFILSVREKRDALKLTFTIFFLITLLFTLTIFFTEKELQPEYYGSIPETMWWTFIRIITLGYSDIYPISALGKIITSLIPIFGIISYALPTGIIASGMNTVFQRINRKHF